MKKNKRLLEIFHFSLIPYLHDINSVGALPEFTFLTKAHIDRYCNSK